MQFVAIYIGDGTVVQDANSKKGITVSEIYLYEAFIGQYVS